MSERAATQNQEMFVHLALNCDQLNNLAYAWCYTIRWNERHCTPETASSFFSHFRLANFSQNNNQIHQQKTIQSSILMIIDYGIEHCCWNVREMADEWGSHLLRHCEIFLPTLEHTSARDVVVTTGPARLIIINIRQKYVLNSSFVSTNNAFQFLMCFFLCFASPKPLPSPSNEYDYERSYSAGENNSTSCLSIALLASPRMWLVLWIFVSRVPFCPMSWLIMLV